MQARQIVREVSVVFLAVAACTWLVGLAAQTALSAYAQLALAAVFLGTALHMARRTGAGPEAYGIALGGLLAPPEPTPDAPPEAPEPGSFRELASTLLRGLPSAATELGVALALAALIFPPFGWAFAWFHGAPGPLHWDPPADLADFIVGQVVVVALPEEALFRGYIQTRLSDLWPSRRRLFGADISVPAWLLQAALFAVLHVLSTGGAARLAVFFPALLFGWLRAFRGGIGAAVFFHALSNLCSELLTRGLW